MRKLSLTLAAAAVLACSAFAQTSDMRWRWAAPEDEEFAVLMPGPYEIEYFHLPLAGGLKMPMRSYEAERGGVRFSVIPFRKRGSFESLDGLVAGLRHALTKAAGGDYALKFERDVTLDGRPGKQFLLTAGEPRGTVRAYEAADHYYVLMTHGGTAGEPDSDLFFSSFRLAGPGTVAAGPPAGRAAAEPPPPLWESSRGVVIGERAPDVQGGSGPRGRRAPISGGVLNGKIVSRVAPVYPPIAKAARAQGLVVVQIIVGEGGEVISANAISGHPLLQQAAVAAVRQWRFSPTRLEGKPVKVIGTVTVNFILEEKKPPPTRDF
ncbi:MAG TPA: energy transducer TonB [Pyrinomonadaceae bacterium]|nr:energy transducer TonB [Pyrinomonadaceae bacterium]